MSTLQLRYCVQKSATARDSQCLKSEKDENVDEWKIGFRSRRHCRLISFYCDFRYIFSLLTTNLSKCRELVPLLMHVVWVLVCKASAYKP